MTDVAFDTGPQLDPRLAPYQIEGAQFLAPRHFAYLADEMGVGKTAQAVAAADLLQAKRIVVVCPSIAREHWRREFDSFGTLPRESSVMFSGKDDPDPNGITVVTYDLLRKPEVRAKFAAYKDYVLICDEAHYLANRKSQQTKAIVGDPRYRRKGMADHASHWWCLSGTPAKNYPDELWAVLRKGGAYDGDYWSFVDRFCTGYEDQYKFRITGAKNISELRQLLNGYLLRRMKKDVMEELPNLKIQYMNVELGQVDIATWFPWSNYGDVRDIRQQLREEGQTVMTVMKRCETPEARLKALEGLQGRNTGMLRRFVGLAKVPAVVEQLKHEFEHGLDKVVIFAVHRDVIETLWMELQAYGPVKIYGGTAPRRRQTNIDKFQNNPNCKVFIGQMAAAGTAVTLHAAKEVLVVEPDWVPGNNAQAIMRVHRKGQTRPVRVRFVIGNNAAVDTHIVKLVKRKVQSLNEIFDTRD